MTNIREAYDAEQGTLVSASSFLFLCFIVQTWAERYLPGKLSRTQFQYKFHRLGVIACLLMLLVSIDPVALHDIYTPGQVAWIFGNVSFLILAMAIALNDSSVTIIYQSQYEEVPFIFNAVHFMALFVGLVVCNLCYALSLSHDRLWFTGLWMLYSSFVLVVIMGTFFLFSRRQYELIVSEDRSVEEIGQLMPSSDIASTQQGGAIDMDRQQKRLKVRAFLIYAFGLLLIPSQLYLAVTRLSDRGAHIPEPDYDSFRFSDRFFFYVVLMGLTLALRLSWVPLNHAWRALRARPSKPNFNNASDIRHRDVADSVSWRDAAEGRLNNEAKEIQFRSTREDSSYEVALSDSELAGPLDEDM